MAGVQLLAEEWLAKNRPEMISCPFQPGNLIISKRACFHRHILGQREKLKLSKNDDFFYYKFKKGLFLCRRCPIGGKLANANSMN